MRFIKDKRLYTFPRVQLKQEAFIVKFTALSPFLLSTAHQLIISPVEIIWRIAMSAIIFDAVFFFCLKITAFKYLSLDRMTCYLWMGGLLLVWLFERLSRYSICRAIFGKKLRISISKNNVSWRRILPGKSFPISDQTTFSLEKVASLGQEGAYENAMTLFLVLHSNKRVKIAQFSDPIVAQKVYANLLTALELNYEINEFDIDPIENRREVQYG